MLVRYSNASVDYQAFSALLSDGCPLLRTYYYNCMPYKDASKPTPEQIERFANMQRFIDKLRNLDRYDVRLGKLEYRGENDSGKPIFVQKRVDILLGCDLVLLASKSRISKAVLFTGDSDFIPAIEIAKNEGVEIVLYYSNERDFKPHASLLQIVDERKGLDKAAFDGIPYIK